MKKIFLIVITCLLAAVGFSQIPNKTPLPGNPNTRSTASFIQADSSFLMGHIYDDTVDANRSRVKFYDGAFLQTKGGFQWNRWHNKWWLNGSPNALCPGTHVVSGSVTWSGIGLIFDATNIFYYIGCNPYQASATTLTLSLADPSYPRIDKFYADTNGVIGITTGVPAPNPQEPVVNQISQIDLGFVYVPAGSTVPAGFTQTIIYNNNNEWGFSSDILNANPAYTTAPYIAPVSVDIPQATLISRSPFFGFTNSFEVNLSTSNYLKFWVKLNDNNLDQGGKFMLVKFKNAAGVQVTPTWTVIDGAYGFNQNIIGQWQLVTIPITQFIGFGVSASILQFTISNAPLDFQVDYVYLLSTSTPPVNNNAWLLGGNTGTNPPVTQLGTKDSVALNLATNNQTRLIIGAHGIRENTRGSLRMLMYDDNTDSSYWRRLDSVGVLGCLKLYDSAGVKWIRDTCSGGGGGSGWALTGNSGTTAGTNFVGTTDDVDVVFKRNGAQAGRIGAQNTSFGADGFPSTATGQHNSAFGWVALPAITSGADNTGIGTGAGSGVSTGNYNTLIGSNSGSNVNGTGNTSVGYQALTAAISSNFNTAVGYQANISVNTVSSAIALGYQASATTTGQFAISPSIVEIKATGIPTGAGYGLIDVAGDGIYTSQGTFYTSVSSVGDTAFSLNRPNGTKDTISFTGAGGGSPAGNYGNIQLNRNGVNAATDSLSFNGGILNVNGNAHVTGNIYTFDNTATGINASSFGNGNSSSGASSFTVGENGSIDEDSEASSIIYGYDNHILNSNDALCGGTSSSIFDGDGSIAIGVGNSATTGQATAVGGAGNSANALYSGTFAGTGNIANGVGSVAIGGTGITANKDNTVYVPALNIGVVPAYADNAAALSGGLSAGDIYRTGDLLKVVH